MTTFKNVLLTTDLSKNSSAAIPFAAGLAQRNGGTVHLFHVFEDDAGDALASGVVIGVSAWIDSMHKQRGEKIAELAKSIELEYGVKTVHATASGDVGTEAVKYAKHCHADVIVIATHGRTGLAHLMLGSVTERVVRLSTTPVLTVRPGEQVLGSTKLKTILMPTDFSENSAAAEPHALALAKQDGATLVLAHVIDDTIYYANLEQSVYLADAQQWLDAMVADVKKSLQVKAEALAAKSGVKVETVVGRGRVADQIGAIADESKAEMLVISTHGYTGLSHLVFGSTAEKIVRTSKIPVLSIKPEKIEARK